MFSESETRRTIVLVSTSGGSGGYAGAVDFAADSARPLDAAIVLGDLAGTVVHKPFVLPSRASPAWRPKVCSSHSTMRSPKRLARASGAPGVAASSRTWRCRSPPANRRR